MIILQLMQARGKIIEQLFKGGKVMSVLTIDVQSCHWVVDVRKQAKSARLAIRSTS